MVTWITECEEVVNEGVQGFIDHSLPRHVRYRLQLVVNEQLGKDDSKQVRRKLRTIMIYGSKLENKS